MKTLGHTNKAPLVPEPSRLTIMLPLGQDIREMSFTKEQRSAIANKRITQTPRQPPLLHRKPGTDSIALKTIKSTSALSQYRDTSRPGSAKARTSSDFTSRKSSTYNCRDPNWQDMEIPSELEAIPKDTPEEIRNIIQETIDEHRATRASRIAQPQAIVVRTTITQWSKAKDGTQSPLTESSASVSSRRAGSSSSGEFSSTRSLGFESTTSLASSEGENDFLKTSMTSDGRSQGSKENTIANSKSPVTISTSSMKPLPYPNISKPLTGLRKVESSTKEWDEAHRKIRDWDLPLPDEKALEKSAYPTHRYYCASPLCAKWIDGSSTRTHDGALRCPRCAAKICPTATSRSYETLTKTTSERSTSRNREAEEERLAEEAKRMTAREYERLAGITELFGHLRETLEKVRLQQKRAIEQRHKLELQKVEEKEAALICGEKILDRDQKVAKERSELVKKNQHILRDLRRSHALQLMDTVRRHRADQDAYIARSIRQMEASEDVDQAGILEMLLQAQDVERKMLRSQQTREMLKWEKRGPRLLEAFDAKAEGERQKVITAQVKEAEEVMQMLTGAKKQMDADWKWFNAIFLDRTMALGEDERRCILSGSHAPTLPSNSLLSA